MVGMMSPISTSIYRGHRDQAIVTLPSLAAHWQSTDQHNTGIMANSECMVILQRICLQMSGTENICAFFHYLCQLQLAFWLFLQNLCPKKCPGTLLCCALSVVTSLWLSLPGGEQEFVVLCSDPSVLQPVFTITEKAPTRAFSWLEGPTSAFTFKTLC